MKKLTTPFTKDQCEWLEDNLTSLFSWFAYQERASRKLKEKLAKALEEVKAITLEEVKAMSECKKEETNNEG